MTHEARGLPLAWNQDSHYAGNFWWADCQHVALLPPMPDRYYEGSAESFILNTSRDAHISRDLGFQCGFSMFNCDRNLYLSACTRDLYRPRLMQHVLGELGPSHLPPPRPARHPPATGAPPPPAPASNAAASTLPPLPDLAICTALLRAGRPYYEEPQNSSIYRWWAESIS
eukprot:EG_transcript_19394